MKPTVLYYTNLSYCLSAREHMDDAFDVIEVIDPTWDPRIREEERASVLAIFCPLGFSYTDKLLSRSFPNLRFLVTNTTTADHITATNYQVISLQGEELLEGITSTSEHTLGLIHAIHRRISAAFDEVKNTHKFNRYNWSTQHMLSAMNLGIVGLGRVGRHLKERAKPLFKNIYHYDNSRRDGTHDTLLKLARDSDVLSLHANWMSYGGMDNTRFIDHYTFENLQSGYFISTADHHLVNHSDLLESLKTGLLRGAALDTLPGEHTKKKPPIYHDLLQHARENDNLIITPHIAGSTVDAWEMTQICVVDKLVKELRR